MFLYISIGFNIALIYLSIYWYAKYSALDETFDFVIGCYKSAELRAEKDFEDVLRLKKVEEKYMALLEESFKKGDNND